MSTATAPRLSSLVRRLAREHAIDLAEIAGSGLAGRVTGRDVQAFLAARPAARQRTPAAGPAAGPHPGFAVAEAELDGRNSRDAGVLAQVCVAVAAALRRFPALGPGGDGVRLAVGTPGGSTAVVPDAHELVPAAVERRLRAAGEPAGAAAFAVADCGDSPVLVLPRLPEGQVAAIAVGRARRRPAVVSVDGGEAIAIRDGVPLALAWDPAAVPDATAVEFLAAVTARLEHHETRELREAVPRVEDQR